MPSRIVAFCSARCCLVIRAEFLRSATPRARALAAASASRRLGVGRPLPPSLTTASETAASSVLRRRNTGAFLAGSGSAAVPHEGAQGNRRGPGANRPDGHGNLLLHRAVGP